MWLQTIACISAQMAFFPEQAGRIHLAVHINCQSLLILTTLLIAAVIECGEFKTRW